MKTSLTKILQKAARIFFVLSLWMSVFSVTAVFLRWSGILEITLPYQVVWLVVIVIALLLLGIFEAWKKFLLILFLGVTNFLFLLYVASSLPITVEKPIQNSDYRLEAGTDRYRILKSNCCYTKVIAAKLSGLFFTHNMKTGLVPSFEAQLLQETDEIIILEIRTSGVIPKMQDTITKLK